MEASNIFVFQELKHYSSDNMRLVVYLCGVFSLYINAKKILGLKIMHVMTDNEYLLNLK